jgi:hypothetical protein
MRCPCGGNTVVMETRTVDNTPKRKRKCELCNQAFYTLETFLEMASGKPGRKPNPIPEPKPMAKKAAEVHRKRVEVRRSNEDRKMKVSSYFIEEEDW